MARTLPLLAAALFLAAASGERSPERQARQNREEDGRALEEGTAAARRDLRAQQNVLTSPEQRALDRGLDRVEGLRPIDPRAAEDRLRIERADESLSTINRAIPGGPPTPSPVGPGDRH